MNRNRQSKLVKICVVYRFESLWIVLDSFGSFWIVLNRFESFWVVLNRFGSFWIVWIVLNRFESFWIVLNRFESFWIVSDPFGLFWIVLDRFGLFWIVIKKYLNFQDFKTAFCFYKTLQKMFKKNERTIHKRLLHLVRFGSDLAYIFGQGLHLAILQRKQKCV